MGKIAKEILFIAFLIAAFQQAWITCGGDPATVGAWEAGLGPPRKYLDTPRASRTQKSVPLSTASPALDRAVPSVHDRSRQARGVTRLTQEQLAHAETLGISPYLYWAIIGTSETFRIPAGLLYGIKLSESGKDEFGTGGNCLVMDQLEIRDKWLASSRRHDYDYDGKRHPNGEANRLAIQEIAKRHGYDWTKIIGSCGASTLDKRGRSYGGCITGMGINPISWVNDPELRDKNPWDVYWALYWTAKRLRKEADAAKNEGLDEYAALERAVRKHAGHWDGWYAWNYFNNKVATRWQTWNEAHGVAAPELLASN